MRPRTSSLTSIPSIVKPVTQVIPANAPRMMVIKIETVKFGMRDKKIRKIPDVVREAPNKRRRENWAKTLGPIAIPSARPVKTAPKRTPYAASPPPKSPTNVRASPMTAPAAENAPTIPMIRPRMTFDSLTERHPFTRAAMIDSSLFLSFFELLGISLSPQTVTAAKRKVIALM
ncbi:unannotated protein [freshwater metagenome]|uniref:Unannotated protein n=1 Tax=freshwater metagenome TaxID=449393 RepID=A0A6J6K215_9ZZZZ